MSMGMIAKLAEFCVVHGWNFEITAAIVETAIIFVPFIAFAVIIFYVITKESE